MSIRLDRVSKAFGDYPAIRDVSLEAEPGEFLALLGPSGSGKTTLLRIMAGLEFPDSGRVSFEGEEVTDRAVAERRVGFVFQHYALFRHMTVADNVGFGLSVRKRRERPNRAAIRARVAELLDLVQLGDLDGRYPAQLSGGQRQRVALARALAVDPRLLLLDEPFGALDAKVRKELRHWLRALHDRVGLTSIFVTHDQEEALEMADRVVVMRDGRIEQIATPAEIYASPANAFVFDFVGEANAVPVRVEGGSAMIEDAPIALPFQPAVEGRAMLCFRPHDAEIGRDGAGLRAQVTGVRPRAGRCRLDLTVTGAAAPVEVDAPGECAAAVGDAVVLRLKRACLYPEERA